MPVSKASLSGKLVAAIGPMINVGDAAQLQKICDAIAEAVVAEIKSATVTVLAVTPGSGTATGTVT